MELVAGLVDAGASVETVVLDVLVPAQREVGLRWERRQWNVAQEHAATAIADTILAELALPDPPSDRGHVVVGCVEGEWHIMAARMTAEVFRQRGWSVTFLGPSVPGVDLAAYAASTAPDAVVLSCSVPTLLPGARRCIHACLHEGVAVLTGGAGFGPDGRYARTLGADGWAADPASGVRRVDGWLDEPPPDRRPPTTIDDEQLLLEASRPELVVGAVDRMTSGRPGSGQAELREGVDMAVAAVESASLVGRPELLSACAPMIERALPEPFAGPDAVGSILAGLLPELRRRSPRAAMLVERALPTVE